MFMMLFGLFCFALGGVVAYKLHDKLVQLKQKYVK